MYYDNDKGVRGRDPEHVYYNIDRYNNTQSIISSRTSQNRTSAILPKASDYKMAVVRFQFSTLSIPILNYEDDWYVTLRYLGVNYTQQLVYIPDDLIPAPNQPIYHYSIVMEMINNALGLAYGAMLVAEPTCPALEQPRMLFNKSDSRFSILYPNVGYQLGNTTGAGVEVYFNYPLYSLFDNFPDFWLYDGVQFNADRRDVRLLVLNSGSNLVDISNNPSTYFGSQYNAVVFAEDDYFMMTQEFPTLNLWSPYNKIIITVPSLGARAEWLTNYNSDGQEVSFPILTDFEIDFAPDQSARNIYTYNPSGEYRFIDLTATEPLYVVDTAVFYQNQRTGQMNEIQLLPNQGYSVKMLFQRK